MEILEFKNLAELKNLALQLDVVEPREVTVQGYGETKDYYCVFNKTRGKIATIATQDYTIVQHRDLVEAISDNLSRLNLKASGQIKNLGDKIYVECVFDDKLLPDGEKGIKIGIRFVNSTDRSNAIRGDFYGMRLVCENGMVLRAWGTEVYKMHMGEVDVQGVVTKLIEKIVEKYEEAEHLINAAIGDSIEWEYVDKVMQKLFKDRSKHLDVLKKEIEIVKNEKGELSRWDFYNVITRYATHGSGKLLSQGVQDWLQNKAEKILTKKVVVEIE